MYYENELKALKRSKRFRERKLIDENYIDLASNDYLSLAHNKTLFTSTCKALETLEYHAPKAAMLVNGYHSVHKEFEDKLCEVNGFEAGVILGSGFNANIAMIEALCRKGDVLFMDEKYHASGVVATKMIDAEVDFFSHNNSLELEEKLKHSKAKRRIIAVEGIYSMDGDLMNRDIFALADTYDAILIVDEAHSSGVVGEKLMGVFDLYDIKIKPNHIKMGTLGKAYGSFGGYILSSTHINTYLLNRAKPIIYATAPSLFDTLLAHNALLYILENRENLKQEIRVRQALVKELLGLEVGGLIVPIIINDNEKVMQIQKELHKSALHVGAIRQPTVEKAIIRLIARVGVDMKYLREAIMVIKNLG